MNERSEMNAWNNQSSTRNNVEDIGHLGGWIGNRNSFELHSGSCLIGYEMYGNLRDLMVVR